MMKQTTRPPKPEAGEKQVERVRRICLALPETREKISHGEPAFFVGKKVFAMCSINHHNDGHLAVTMPAAIGIQAMLIEQNPKKYYKPPYVGGAGWIGVELPKVSDKELALHLGEAWRLIAPAKLQAGSPLESDQRASGSRKDAKPQSKAREESPQVTMPKYVAFLRAINVGGHTVKMDHLRGLFEAIGFTNVETFIASGNVIFDSPAKNTKAIEQKIEKHLQKSLGYEVATFVRSTAEVGAVASYKPFNDSEIEAAQVFYIVFLADAPSAEVANRLLSYPSQIDQFHINERELYWLRRGNFSDSKFSGPLLEKTLGMKATARNSTTVRKIAAKYGTDSVSPRATRR
jgi:uncharacterized protein (DUF1697 family)